MWPALNAYDRCDHGDCSAQALIRFYQATRDLMFCGHHSYEHEEILIKGGFLLFEDRRADLLKEDRLKGEE